MAKSQRPLELILARNLMTSLSTPAFLVDEAGALIFYNEAAGSLIGRRFEELGADASALWEHVGPFDAAGVRLPVDDLPLTLALRAGSPSHAEMHIRSFNGADHVIAVSALPIVSARGARGAMAFFWPQASSEGEAASSVADAGSVAGEER
jgi:PAS domain-containing protein